MATIDLSKYGITGVEEVLYNPSYETLFEEETKEGLTGFDKGVVTEMGAVNVMTGVYTGRSPKDKFFVMDETTKDTIWWTSEEYKNDNKPVTKETWAELKTPFPNRRSTLSVSVNTTYTHIILSTKAMMMFNGAYSARSESKVVNEPAPANKGKTKGTKVASLIGP